MSQTIHTVHATSVYERGNSILVECTWRDDDGELFVASYEFELLGGTTVETDASIDPDLRPLVTDALAGEGYELA